MADDLPPTPDQTVVDAVADELYAADPDRFTIARQEAARSLTSNGQRSEAKAVTALRKPSLVGWALNLLVREDRVQVDSLLSVGAELRHAQVALSGADLRRLTAQRHKVVRAVASRAAALAEAAGRPLSNTVVEQVARSLDAALADPSVADQLVTGRVTGELSYAGLGDPAPAVPTLRLVTGQELPSDPDETGTPTATTTVTTAQRRRATRAAERAVDDAAAELAAAEDRLARARESAQAATLRSASATQTVETIEAELETARAELTAAQHEEEVAERAVDLAEKTQDRAAQRMDAARTALASLTSPTKHPPT